MSERALITRPLLVADGGDLMFFRSEEDLSRYIEPPADLPAYDADGRRLMLGLEPRTITRRLRFLRPYDVDYVVVASSEPDPTHAAELAGLLRDFLERTGSAPPLGTSLPELMQLAIERAGYT